MRPTKLFTVAVPIKRQAATVSIITISLLLVGCAHESRRPVPITVPVAADPDFAQRLTPGMTGKLGGEPFTVAAAARVEVVSGKRTWKRHEFDLIGPAGLRALLLNGLNGNLGEWHLLVPPQLPPVFSPDDAAAKLPGAEVVADLTSTRITETWQSRTVALAGDPVLFDPGGQWLKGFTTRGTNEWMLVRWHEFRMWIHIGRVVSGEEVARGFGLTPVHSEAAR